MRLPDLHVASVVPNRYAAVFGSISRKDPGTSAYKGQYIRVPGYDNDSQRHKIRASVTVFTVRARDKENQDRLSHEHPNATEWRYAIGYLPDRASLERRVIAAVHFILVLAQDKERPKG